MNPYIINIRDTCSPDKQARQRLGNQGMERWQVLKTVLRGMFSMNVRCQR